MIQLAAHWLVLSGISLVWTTTGEGAQKPGGSDTKIWLTTEAEYKSSFHSLVTLMGVTSDHIGYWVVDNDINQMTKYCSQQDMVFGGTWNSVDDESTVVAEWRIDPRVGTAPLDSIDTVLVFLAYTYHTICRHHPNTHTCQNNTLRPTNASHHQKCDFTRKTAVLRFWAPFGGLGATYDDHLRPWGSIYKTSSSAISETRAAGWVSFSQKWKTAMGIQYSADIIDLSSTTVM